MSCITNHFLNKHTQLGVWNIEEDYKTLLASIQLSPEEMERVKGFRSNSRKIEFLSVRALLQEMAGVEKRIVYNENRKPFIQDKSAHISISHSNNLTSLILGRKEKVGIDLEYMSHNISRLAFKFINKHEYITRNRKFRRYHLYIHWCAKEALYKICDKEGINIQKDIIISPFELRDSGTIYGHVYNDRMDETFPMEYVRYNNYVIVWTLKDF